MLMISGLSFKAYGLKSDSSSWALLYACWESGQQTWYVAGKPGTVLSQNVKTNILKDVESFGFRSTDYVQVDHSKCAFDTHLFYGSDGNCDCCKTKQKFQTYSY